MSPDLWSCPCRWLHGCGFFDLGACKASGLSHGFPTLVATSSGSSLSWIPASRVSYLFLFLFPSNWGDFPARCSMIGSLQAFLVGQHFGSLPLLPFIPVFYPLVLEVAWGFFLRRVVLLPFPRANFRLPCRCSSPLNSWVPSFLVPVSGMATPELLSIFPVVLDRPSIDLFSFVGCNAPAVTIFVSWHILRVPALVLPCLFPCSPRKFAF